LVPIQFLEMFVDKDQINLILKTEQDYVAQLSDSIDTYGLQRPGRVYYDAAGKLRFQDGHHRYAATRNLGYFHSFPVSIEASPTMIAARGRQISLEIPAVFGLFAADANVRSSNKVTLKPVG